MDSLMKKRFLPPLAILFFLIFLFNSCSKENIADKNESNQDKEIIKINENDYNESDEDIFTVDYKEFYDELSPKGEWIQVDGEELGLKLKTGTASGEYEIQKDLFNYITGIKNAYAENIDLGMFFVWKPSPDLAVSVGTNPVQSHYTPYSNGQWLNTDAGWYFKAPTPAEEITSHYGRWVSSPGFGWVWVPGRVWSPAWVDWRENENYIAWAPIPPGGYIVNNIVSTPTIEYDSYVVVEKRYFIEPLIYSYIIPTTTTTTNSYVIVKETSPVIGVMVANNVVINRGPDIVNIKNIGGKDVVKIKVNKVNNKNSAGFNSTTINVYTPNFKKVKTNGKIVTTVNSPSNFVSNNEAKNIQNEGKSHNKIQGNKNNEKNLDKGNDVGSEKNLQKNNNGNKNKSDYNQGSNKSGKNKGNYNQQEQNNSKKENSVNKNNKGNNNDMKNEKSKGNSQNKKENQTKGKGKK